MAAKIQRAKNQSPFFRASVICRAAHSCRTSAEYVMLDQTRYEELPPVPRIPTRTRYMPVTKKLCTEERH
ncbi:hypothetical protein E2C01_073269 [Portunus trituberculatus]|uniref:Uncharacterized protein n=1 Tax=Portunus trituberculatus TaxID=210409 RepID=A0A5B7I4S1_PORTR|nr:hypothetical protein [Portunus trituberculatus]